MSARTCLLCGKSLSRFLTGNGDYCSREHRNQYQMRMGMDRLNEASKVASVMRRRENPKLISAAHLMSDYAVAPRDFGSVAIRPTLPSLASLRPTPAGLPAPKVPSSSNDSQWLGAIRAAGSGEPTAARLSIAGASSGRRTVVPPPVRTHRFTVAIPPARIALARNRFTAPAPRRREFGILRHTAVRVHLGSELRASGVVSGPAGAEAARAARGARIPHHAALKGKALHISAGIGFRLRPPIRLSFESPGPGPVVTPLLERPHRVAPRAGSAATTREAEIPLPRTTSSYHPPEIRNGSVSSPRGVPARLRCAVGSPNGAARACQSPWTAAGPQLPQPEFDGGSPGFTRSGATLLFRAAPSPAAIDAVQRPTLVPFAPGEVPFEYTTAVDGAFGGGVPAQPPPAVKPQPATARRIEEHFSNGFANWTGGNDTWKLDAAGVRIGKLALFSPSLEWDDYDLEFLARIERHSISWVFRAANLDKYYQATIAKTPGGYEFSRCAVIGGQAEPAVTCAVPGSGPGGAPSKTAITVRMRARAEQFSVSVDNRIVETWTDIRLPIGGIGFVGEPNDRARLYWVTICPVGSLNKELWKQ